MSSNRRRAVSVPSVVSEPEMVAVILFSKQKKPATAFAVTGG
jgi:hypothetical protein